MNNLKAKLKNMGKEYAGLIIFPENRKYFTHFESSNGYLIVNGEKAVFITDGRYIEAAEDKACDCEVLLQENRIFPQIHNILNEMGCSHLLVESTHLTVAMYNSLKGVLKNYKISTDDTLTNMINEIRAVKTPQEVELIVKAQRIAEKSFQNILNFIKDGVTEKEIELELNYQMFKNGGEALSFDTIAISGTNTSMPHGVPSDKIVRNGDFVTMDFGTMVGGYHSDMTRTVAVGFATDEMADVYNTVLDAQLSCLNGLCSGLSCHDGDKLARDVIESKGYGQYFTHSTGHSVGVEIHEEPRLAPHYKEILKTGNIVTVEPGIYIPKKFGVRIEDMALITDNGCENLTKAPKELIIL